MSPDDDDLTATAVHHAVRDDEVDSTGRRKRLVAEAQASGYESAEAVYRTVLWLRDRLPAEAQTQLAVCFEWAREGLVLQSAGEVSEELKALHAAYGYARDVMVAAARKSAEEKKKK
ncbi:MAG TPA: hypothetical protein VJ764_01710 [Steroidobacteraceae bacterium]|nr:hypothetical protein [Steroidobacteraceae bacterium]